VILQSLLAASIAFIQSPTNSLVGGVSISAQVSASSSQTVDNPSSSELSEKQRDFTLGYLNKHHKNFLTEAARAFSDFGTEMAKANAWSGGSFVIKEAEIVSIDTKSFELKVTVEKRKSTTTEVVTVDLGEALLCG
jgi:hypothetical protein